MSLAETLPPPALLPSSGRLRGPRIKEVINQGELLVSLPSSFREHSRFLLPEDPYAEDIIPSTVNCLLEKKLTNNFRVTFLALILEGHQHAQDLWSS